MGLILCEALKVKKPFNIEVLSLNIHSYEELCYIIFENPILVTEGIVSDTLVEFIRDDLNLEVLADNVKRKMSNGTADEDILVYIIDSCSLYNNAEKIIFRNAMGKIKKMAVHEVAKQRADYMFYIGKYDLAKKYYLEILDMDTKAENGFIGSVYHNLGVIYANLFLYEEALDALKKSYELTNDDVILMEIYFLKRIFISSYEENDEEMSQLLKADLAGEAKKAFDIALEGVGESERMKNINSIFETEDTVRKKKILGDYIADLKADYRNMK
ncbi:tetratricopeptide repeat protein [Lachnoanaerobaculum gingivalis]|uniref:tetratricopeptide repeat protein n=1 Tax=Lachnoanaerobaculum gingivalis TaxID=2490855 RepID=UPI0024A755EC|nr:tetratricopeptide repeat protein [Lachnoanaerobaculum gingivalis]WHE86154.1 tetratricopeptide repeat protein [Lachnoanaerobaculum gingivalis]